MQDMTKLADRDLVVAYANDSNEAFDILLERHKDRIYTYIFRIVKNRELTDDIFQETFIKAVRVIDEGRYVDSGKFLSWILRIAHNQVIDYFRARKQNRQVNESEAGYDMLAAMRLAEGSVEDAMVSEQTEREVRALVEMLPAEQREVVLMRYFGGLSFKEIADATGVSINTALGRMRYALMNMRRIAEENNIVLSA